MQSPARYLAIAVWLLAPASALAQASLTGTVRDTSGAVLPGVTVEAASPALIEKVRVATTDDTGQFRIVDLRPGTYTLTATLPGFVTVRRQSIELSGSQTLTIPLELRVGGLEETITVTGETPVVDVQSVRREVVLTSDIVQTIPATRAVGALLNATPGLNVADAGLALSPTMTSFSARSSSINANSVNGEGRYTVNGMTVSAARSGGHSSYVYDTVNTDEVAITVGGGLGETDIGGPVMNIIPRSGGNTFSGSAFTSLAGDWSRGDNLDDEIRARNPNLQQTPGIINAYDASGSFGGPIMKDRLWFYGSFRDLSTQTAMEGISANANAGDASRWDWVGSPIEARLVQDRRMVIGRMTGQFGQHRLRFNSEYQHRCEGTPLRVESDGCHNRGEDWIGLGNNTGTQMSPEATSTAGRGYFDVPFYVNQGAWTMPATNKLLLEAGYTAFRYQPIFGHPAPDGITNLIPVTEQSNAINPATGQRYAPVANYRYRAVESWGPAHGHTDGVTGSASYVTGAHSAKVGYQFNRLDLLDKDVPNQTQLGYRFNQGVPNAVSYYLPGFGRRTVTTLHGFYFQNSWTRERLTLQGAVRYDRAASFAPVELNGTPETSFLNPGPITIEKTKGVDAYHDITPRVGVAYDVFGNGRTALKFNWGRYLAYAANDNPYTSTNPGATVVRNVQNRGWTDTDRDLVVDCNLLNPDLNGECAALTGNARNFGQLGAQQVVNPEVLSGWGRRPHDYQTTATIQQQLLPRLSAEVSYTHRTWHSFFVTDDLTRADGNVASYYDSYTLTAPSDPRLAGGGGYPITVFVPTVAAAAVSARQYLTLETDFGPGRDSYWDGVDVTISARLRNGLTAQVGTSTGRGVVDTCETATRFNNVQGATIQGPDPRGCNNTEPWQTNLRGLASYTIPKVDVLVSATLRSQAPETITATWQVPNSVIAAALGRLPVGATATGNTNIPLTDNEHRVYSDERRTQIDMRFAKIFRFGRTRTDVGIDVTNLLNTNYVTNFNTTYIYSTDNAPRPGGWGSPTTIYTPRFVRLNFTVNF